MLYALNADSLKPTCSKDKIACKVHGQCLKETLDKCLPGIINNPRVVAQSGMLVYMKKIIEETSSGSIERSIPLDEILLSCSTDKSQFSLIKIYMREDFRDLVLTLLNTMNINGRTLFPELLGAGKYANMAMDIVDYDPMMKIFNTV